MEFGDVVRRRRMVRNFDERPLAPEVVDRLVATATRGPSAGFTQGVDLLVLEGAEQTGRFWEAASAPDGSGARAAWPGVLKAPLLIVPLSSERAYRQRFAEPDKRGPRRGEEAVTWPAPWWHVDAAFTAMLVLLAAVDGGLGALFFGVSDAAALRDAFAIPDDYSPVGAVAVGHPRPDRPSASLARGRRPPGEVVHRGSW